MTHASLSRWILLLLMAIGWMFGGCKTTPKASALPEPPAFEREFRGAWVTTWENVDWPSKGSLSTAQQQQEIDAIIERAMDLKLNALMLQVRGTANAIYPSKYEPWAGSLTGKRGKAPNPPYDPLKMWIEKAHAAGIELHAWMVPFVAWNEPAEAYKGPHRPTTRRHGSFNYFDPGDPDTRSYLLGVFKEVTAYSIDAVCFEHHVYPPTTLPSTQPTARPDRQTGVTDPSPIQFPDDDTYKKHGNGMERDAWRRENINTFIRDLRQLMHKQDPELRLGISPFGIPSPDTPEFVKGAPYHDQYKTTHADPGLWLRKGWCDYMMPELYWKTGSKHQPFLGLLKWWADPKRNPKDRNVYAGLFTSHVSPYSTSWSPDEISGQIMITRETPDASGHGHFSMRALTQNRKGLADQLRDGVYSDGALPPPNPWLGKEKPPAPTNLKAVRVTADKAKAAITKPVIVPPLAQKRTTPPSTDPFVMLAKPSGPMPGLRLTWDAPASDKIWRWTVYSRHGSTWKMQVVGRGWSKDKKVILTVVADDPKHGPANAVAVSTVDRLGNESTKAKVKVP